MRFLLALAVALASGCSGTSEYVAIEDTETYDSPPTFKDAALSGKLALGEVRKGNCGTTFCQFLTNDGKGVNDHGYAYSFLPYPIKGGTSLSVTKATTLYRDKAMKTKIAQIAQGTAVVAIEGTTSPPPSVVLLVHEGKPLGYASRNHLGP